MTLGTKAKAKLLRERQTKMSEGYEIECPNCSMSVFVPFDLPDPVCPGCGFAFTTGKLPSPPQGFEEEGFMFFLWDQGFFDGLF